MDLRFGPSRDWKSRFLSDSKFSHFFPLTPTFNLWEHIPAQMRLSLIKDRNEYETEQNEAENRQMDGLGDNSRNGDGEHDDGTGCVADFGAVESGG